MKREDLFEYKNNREWLEKKKAKIEGEYENIQKMIANYQKNSEKGIETHDKTAENLAILLDMKIETLNFAIKLEEDLNKIDHALQKMKEPYRNILTDVYVNGDSLGMVAKHMKNNYEDVCNQYREALRMYDKL